MENASVVDTDKMIYDVLGRDFEILASDKVFVRIKELGDCWKMYLDKDVPPDRLEDRFPAFSKDIGLTERALFVLGVSYVIVLVRTNETEYSEEYHLLVDGEKEAFKSRYDALVRAAEEKKKNGKSKSRR